MNTSLSSNRERGLTLLELFVILAVISVLAVLAISALLIAKDRARRIQCENNLRSIGLVFRVWAGDNNDKFPMELPATNGGTMEFITGTNTWRHFQVMSNEVSTPKVLICPADSERLSATNFTAFNNANLSLFVGVNAYQTNQTMFLSGDRNITDVRGVKNGLLEVTTNSSADWTPKLHKNVGNILFPDGTVRPLSPADLRMAIANTGGVTNRLQMPILGP